MENKDVYEELSSIKNIMERSTKFISLSGLSGVLAGVYALAGAGLVYRMNPDLFFLSPAANQGIHFGLSNEYVNELFTNTVLIALAVLVLSIVTGLILSARKAKSKGQSVWNESSRALLRNGLVPLLTGGAFLIILVMHHSYGLIAPACLVFYGLALYGASQYTYGDVKWLGLSEILLGLICLAVPVYGLFFWALGFGVLHILYGGIMYFKYDREDRA